MGSPFQRLADMDSDHIETCPIIISGLAGLTVSVFG